MRLCILPCLFVLVIVSSAYGDDVKKSTRSTKKGRGRIGDELGDRLEKIHKKMKGWNERSKKKLALSASQKEELSRNLKKMIHAEFDAKAPKRFEEINEAADPDGYLFEGDIVLTEEQAEALNEEFADDGTGRKRRQAYNMANYPTKLWTFPIPYKFDSSLSTSAKTIIAKGIAFWEANTCASFKLNGAGANSLKFLNGDGCWSYVGRNVSDPAQEISIGSGCESISTVTHEIGHALGFWHHHARHDRDNYLTINLENVKADMQHNFLKQTTATNNNYGQPYEYGSVMHYGPYSFAINSSVPTMVPKDIDYMPTMGSGREPSFYDVLMMNKLYNCLAKCDSYSTVCKNGGYKDIKNCNICKCPSGYGGSDCSQRTAGCGSTLIATSAYQTFTSPLLGDSTTTIYDDFKECTYWITAPAGKRIQVELDKVGNVCSKGCVPSGVEFKTKSDQKLTGYRFCCPEHKNRTLISELDVLPIIVFNRYYNAFFTIRYKYINTATVSTTIPTTTTNPLSNLYKSSSVLGAWYLIVPELANWTWHENNCISKNMHLVSIHSAYENEFVRDMLVKYGGSHNAYTGLQYKSGVSKYTDGTSVDYTNWASPQAYCKTPGSCTMMFSGKGDMCSSIDCNIPYIGVCK